MRLASLMMTAALLTGCYSLDDVRSQPVVWTATYPAAFDSIANCLAGRYAGEYSVVPQLYQNERRANVILSNTSGGAVLAEFQVRQLGGSSSVVSWRHMGSPAGGNRSVDRDARANADRCGKA